MILSIIIPISQLWIWIRLINIIQVKLHFLTFFFPKILFLVTNRKFLKVCTKWSPVYDANGKKILIKMFMASSCMFIYHHLLKILIKYYIYSTLYYTITQKVSGHVCINTSVCWTAYSKINNFRKMLSKLILCLCVNKIDFN